MRTVLLALLVLMLLSSNALAQGRIGYYPPEFLWGISWNIAVPTGNTKDYTDNVSLRGFGLEGRKYVGTNWSAGLSASWNVFYENSFETVDTDDGATVSGQQFRYLNIWPLLINAHYYTGDYGSWRFYAGLNAGAYIIENRFELGLYSKQETNWHFGVAPAIGLYFPAGRFLGFVDLRYNYTTASGMTPEQSYISINIGVGLH